MALTATKSDIARILGSSHHDPFEILGTHPIWEDGANHVVVRCFRPEAESIEVVDHDTLKVVAPLERRHPEGFYESVIPDYDVTFAYLLRITNHGQHTYTLPDQYSFGPVIKDFDLHLGSE